MFFNIPAHKKEKCEVAIPCHIRAQKGYFPVYCVHAGMLPHLP